MPFLRPQTVAGLARYVVCIPDSPEWRTQLWGAISLLLLDWQWEGDSPLDDENIAAEYAAVLNSFVRCSAMAGLISAYGGATAPDGYLLCDGGSYATDDYPILFEAVGYVFGGAGSTFNVPDLREAFPYGVGPGAPLAASGGAETHTLVGAEMPNHNHDYGGTIEGLHDVPIGLVPVAIPNPFPEQTSAEGGGGAHNNMPPYLALNFVISTGEICSG